MLDYQDVCLWPNRFSDIGSRDEVSLATRVGTINLHVPIFAAPMLDVVDSNNLASIIKGGGSGFIHRFQTKKQQYEEFVKVKKATDVFGFHSLINFGCALGIGEEELERYAYLYSGECRIFVIDIAHAATKACLDFCSKLDRPDTKLIIGNFVHPDQVRPFLSLKNLKAIRIGQATGKSCTTQNATGIYTPMISIIQAFKNWGQIPFIADGGIREPGDVCKAIAAGANAVMAGSIFAACNDSPAPEITRPYGEVYKLYRGSASPDIKKLYKSKVNYIEGCGSELQKRNISSQELLEQYAEGLRSSMSYFGARSITQFQEHSNFFYRH